MSRSPGVLAVLAAFLLGPSAVARGQANRVFASARNGNDLNACNNINTPCQTLQGAVNQVAAGGAVLVLDSGGYGPVTINKAVTVEAPAGVEAFIHPPSGSGITVQAGGTDVVVLRGLTVNGGDYGIDLQTGGALHVERCVLQDFVWDGIVASRSCCAPVFADVYVDDTVVHGSQFDAIGFFSLNGLVRGTVDRSHVTGNPGFGIGGDENSRTVVWKTAAAGNGTGISLFARNMHGSRMVVERCAVENNSVSGVQVSGDTDSPATLWISNSTVTGNGGPGSINWAGLRQLQISNLLSRTNNTVEANVHDTYGSIGSYAAK
jgi:hypothetical protein